MNRTRIIGFRLLKEDFNRALTAAGGQDRLSEWAKGVVLERLKSVNIAAIRKFDSAAGVVIGGGPADTFGERMAEAASKLDKPPLTVAAGMVLLAEAAKSFQVTDTEPRESLIVSDPPTRPSWADLSEPARVDMARVWMVKVPLPAGFKSWDADAKIAWLDSNWPLEPKGEEW